jgi:hypothetical protein
MGQIRKGRSYFKLFDALGQSGCPICSLVTQDGLSYLESLMYERITDVPTRRELMDSFGLCNWHTWHLSRLPRISAPDLRYAILASDLLRKFDGLAETGRAVDKRIFKSVFAKKTRSLRSKIKQRACPACRHVVQFESDLLRQLLELLPDKEFCQAYGASQGICLPHFLLAEEKCFNHPNFRLLLKIQAAKALSLRDTLEQFIEKQDHRNRQKVTSAEAKAGRVTMEFLCGKPGTFNNDIQRGPVGQGRGRFRK